MITQMTIPEKITALQQCMAKSEEVDYSIQVKWGNDQSYTRNHIRTLIDNAKELFVKGNIDRLDYDVRQEAYRKWDTLLNEELKRFPEYKIEEEVTQSIRFR